MNQQLKSSIKPQTIRGQALKIGLVIDDSLDKQDGVQQYVVTLGVWLKNQGHDVHYLTSTTTRTDLSNVHVLSKNIGFKMNANRLHTPVPTLPAKMKALLEREHFDVLHIQMPYSPWLAGQLIRYAGLNTAVIGTFHIYPESEWVAWAAKGLGLVVSRQLKRFDRVLAVSEPAQRFAKEAFNIQTVVIPNMIDVARFMPSKELSKDNTEIKIIFLGRLVERKGCMHLLKAIHYLREQNLTTTKFLLQIGGKGPLKEVLENYVREHELGDIVRFDGFIAEEEKANYLAAADVAVFPSTGGESFGISVVEALAACKGAVLAGDNPGYRTVMNGRSVQLIDPLDTPNFAHTLAKFISSPKEREEAKVWQRAHVQKFDQQVVNPKIVDVYRDALHHRQA
jgi:phosphatidylinositol alpha-mannosyltransferase